jgi:YegS/Rv2252/BmrU family lipid kinase
VDLVTIERFDSDSADVCARSALEANVDCIIAAGGDGTVSKVASVLVGRTDVSLGILPLGTANSIAAGLGIPAAVPGAIELLGAGAARTIDTALANGSTMVLHASLGLHAAAISDTSRDAKHRWGALAYVATAVDKLRTNDPFEVEIQTEEGEIRVQATNIAIANIAPRKTLLAQGSGVVLPDDGLLDLTVIAATTLGEVVATGLHLFGTAVMERGATRANVGYLRAASFRIRTAPPQPLLIDGEDAGEGTLDVSCVPRSLHVVAPGE